MKNLSKTELEYLKGVRVQISTLSEQQDKLFRAAQKTLSPHFDKQWLEDYLHDYLYNEGALPEEI